MSRVFNPNDDRLDFDLMDAVFEEIPMYPKSIRLYEITNALKKSAKNKRVNGRELYSTNMASLITTMTYMYQRYPFCEEEVIDKYTGRHHVVLSRLGDGDRQSKKVLDVDELRKQAMESGLLKWRNE